MNALLEVNNLDVYYGGIHALQHLSMHINDGEIISIIGSNGAGKSTLLRTIAGDKEFKSGQISFRGMPLPLSLIHISEPTRLRRIAV